MNSGIKMPKHSPRIDTIGLKLQIETKLGPQKSKRYFSLLTSYLSLKLTKPEFDKLCISLIGRENIRLHNTFLSAVIKNANLSKTPPPPKQSKGKEALLNGYQRSSLQSLCRDSFPPLQKKGRTPIFRDRKLKDRPSPLGPTGKTHSNVCEEHEVISVEEGEEVEQGSGSPGIYSRSPVKAPLGVFWNKKGTKKVLRHGAFPYTETCTNTCVLPDTISLKKRLEIEGLNFSTESINLMNNGLNVFMKRLVKPCLQFTASRSENRVLQGKYGTILDFQSAMEFNPMILGDDWSTQLEKISSRASEGIFLG